MNVYLDFLGCRLNEAEIQGWANDFSKKGLSINSDIAQSDIIILNTCAVTGEAARKSRQKIRKLHNQSPHAKIVVTGCYASLEAEKVAQILGVDLVIDNKDKENLAEQVIQELTLETSPMITTAPGESVVFTQNRDRAFIKVQDGCRYRCTYCIVTIARGDEKSRSIEDLINEINRHYENGIFEIVLTGVHVGGYGSDINSSLYELISIILDKTLIPRIRLASVEPWDLPENFFDLFNNPRLMPHMHLPIQSGSDVILKKMSRRCRTEEFEQLVEKARKLHPSFNITTDVIVGFPGEEEYLWQQTVDFIQRLPLGHIHIFNYSNREGTKAAGLKGVIDNSIKKQRSKQLHRLAKELTQLELKKQIGRSSIILLESKFDILPTREFVYWGHTENYFKVRVISKMANLGGNLVKVELVDVDQTGCFLNAKFIKSELVNQRLASLPILQT